MRNRILLVALTLGAWLLLKAVDYVIPGPGILVLLSLIIVLMITHSLWLLAAQSRWRRRVRKAGQDTPALSTTSEPWQPSVDIFVSAKNEARVIETCVRNLYKIDYNNYSVCIIDDNSDDQMPTILQSLQNEFPSLRVLRRSADSYPGKSAALNEALPLSKAEVIAVFDADAYVAPDFLRLILPVLEPEGIGAVQAQKRIYERQTGFLPECQASEYALDTYFQMGRDLIGGAVELRGNGQLIKRAALIDVGGWNNKAITDDLDLTMRLLISNWDVRFCPDAHVFEEAVTTIPSLIRQRRRWAEGSIRRYLDYIFPLNSPRRLSFTERLDTFTFTVFFVVPTLIFLEALSEVISFTAGIPIHPYFLALVSTTVLVIGYLNFFIAIRLYRPKLTIPETVVHTFEVNAYVFAHWIPCVLLSLNRILFRQGASTWHRTEHIGHSALH